MPTMLALTRRSKEGISTLCGVYSTKKKARTAATGMMMHLDWTGGGGKWTMTDRGHEITYDRPDGESLVIDNWQVDRALLNGEWVIL